MFTVGTVLKSNEKIVESQQIQSSMIKIEAHLNMYHSPKLFKQSSCTQREHLRSTLLVNLIKECSMLLAKYRHSSDFNLLQLIVNQYYYATNSDMSNCLEPLCRNMCYELHTKTYQLLDIQRNNSYDMRIFVNMNCVSHSLSESQSQYIIHFDYGILDFKWISVVELLDFK